MCQVKYLLHRHLCLVGTFSLVGKESEKQILGGRAIRYRRLSRVGSCARNLFLLVTRLLAGIYDAPAMAMADIGLAMGTGTDVAMESAGITLVQADQRALARASALSRARMRAIRQNLFLAFVYNTVSIPTAFWHPASHLGERGHESELTVDDRKFA